MLRSFLRTASLVAIIAIFCTLVSPWFAREDHRVTYDKEGRYLPTFSLRYLAFAMHDYHEKNGALPPHAVFGKNGQPLLSWRVLILPYIEQEALFRQFKLDEPWDSPHNLELLPKMPQVLCPLEPMSHVGSHVTPFQVFVGKGTPFEGRGGWRFKADLPQTSFTVLIVEAAKLVPWTKPDDINYDENAPLPQFGAFFPGRYYVAMADGHARMLRQSDIKEAPLRAAILRSGANDWPWCE